jgi:hypothetical protein
MNQTSHDHELRELIAALREGVLDEAGSRRLNELLTDDPAARRLYAEYAMLQACLELEHGTTGTPDQAADPVTPAALGRLTTGWQRTLGLFSSFTGLAVLVAVLTTGAFLAGMGLMRWMPHGAEVVQEPQPQPQSQPQPRVPGVIVARLSRTQDCLWLDPSHAPFYHSPLEAGQRLGLEHGLIEISFSSGAKAVVEGPAELVLESENSARLVSGRLAADVPKEASGFAIHTQKLQVVDLGTDFGVSVDKQGGAEVQVYRGKAELRSTDRQAAAKPLVLESNQAARLDAQENTLTTVPVDSIKLRRPRFSPLSLKPAKDEKDDGAQEANRKHSGPIVARFRDGLGATEPDQFVGTAGDGWLSGWQAGGIKRITTNHEVVRGGLLSLGGGDPFLQVTHQSNAERAPWQSHLYVSRRWGDTKDVSRDRPHTVSWRFRMDECQGFRAIWNDGIRFFDYAGKVDPYIGNLEDDYLTWHIGAYEPGERFRVSNGHAYWSWVTTDVVMILGHVYQFVVHVDPGNNSYRATITDLSYQPGDRGKAAYQSGNLRFCNSPEDPRKVGGVLVLGATTGPPGGKKPKDTATRVIYSLDQIQIAPGQPAKTAP